MAQQDRINGLVGTLGIKAPVRVVTTANITLSGEQTIDGVAAVAGDRVLVKDQTTGSENGIYAVATTAWAREPDFDGSRDVVTGTMVRVVAGTVNAGTMWELTTTGAIVIGTTSLAFAKSFGASAVDTHAATSKATPVDADELPLVDSAASFGLKKLTWANLKATFASTFAALAGSASQAFSASTLTVATDAIVPSLNGGQLAGFRNKIINGGMLIAQRGPVALSATINTTFFADRWTIQAAGGTGLAGNGATQVDTAFVSNVCGGALAANWTSATMKCQQRIEAKDSIGFNGKTITVSGKILQSIGSTRNIQVVLQKPTTTADTFSALTTLYTSATFPAVNNVVTSFSQTFTLAATDATLGLLVSIEDSAASSATGQSFLIGDVQIEVGSVATPFEQRPYGTELALCQRYFSKSYNTDVAPGTSTQVGKMSYSVQATANTYFRWDTRFPVSMRAAPTYTVYSTTGASGNVRLNNASDLAVTTEDAGMSGVSLYINRNAGLGDFFWYQWKAEAEL